MACIAAGVVVRGRPVAETDTHSSGIGSSSKRSPGACDRGAVRLAFRGRSRQLRRSTSSVPGRSEIGCDDRLGPRGSLQRSTSGATPSALMPRTSSRTACMSITSPARTALDLARIAPFRDRRRRQSIRASGPLATVGALTTTSRAIFALLDGRPRPPHRGNARARRAAGLRPAACCERDARRRVDVVVARLGLSRNHDSRSDACSAADDCVFGDFFFPEADHLAVSSDGRGQIPQPRTRSEAATALRDRHRREGTVRTRSAGKSGASRDREPSDARQSSAGCTTSSRRDGLHSRLPRP